MKVFEIDTPDAEVAWAKNCMCLCGLTSGGGSGGQITVDDPSR